MCSHLLHPKRYNMACALGFFPVFQCICRVFYCRYHERDLRSSSSCNGDDVPDMAMTYSVVLPGWSSRRPSCFGTHPSTRTDYSRTRFNLLSGRHTAVDHGATPAKLPATTASHFSHTVSSLPFPSCPSGFGLAVSPIRVNL